MLGMKFAKFDPTTYVLCYRKGRLVKEGTGLSFFYFAPFTSLVAVPVGITDAPFIFTEVTEDFQSVTVQGEAVFRVADASRLAGMMNFALDPDNMLPMSEDPEKLPMRVINQVQVFVRDKLGHMPIRDALRAVDDLTASVKHALAESPALKALGIEVLDFSVLAIRPTPESARAFEAGMRERILKEADEAIYARRNAAVEFERSIKENELNTEIAVEAQKRRIRESQMETERMVREKKRVIEDEDMTAKIALEEKNRDLVKLAAENNKVNADMRAYGISAVMDAMGKTDPRIIDALATIGMEPEKLIALSFRGIADRADKIGQLNITPDLLREVMAAKK